MWAASSCWVALADWCEREPGDGESTRVWFVTGGGGFGKTRLAVQVCREAEARGWTAGLLTPGASEAKLQELAEWPGRLLIAVDYAENSPALIGQLVRGTGRPRAAAAGAGDAAGTAALLPR